MRVCTAGQMAAIDRETIDGGIPGLELMERAGTAMTEILLDFLAEQDTEGHGDGCCGAGGEEPAAPRVLVLCGKGNNAGDGLVVARLLAESGISVSVLMLAAREALSPEAGLNCDRLPAEVAVVLAEVGHWDTAAAELLANADAVVDAVFGTGVTPPLRQAHADLFRTVNDAGLPCVALDVPSGVAGDDGRVEPVAVAADLTITVQMPKRGLLLPPGRDFAGEIVAVDIGFPTEICERHADDLHWLDRAEYLELLPPRPTDTHKYRCGRLLIAAGSRDFGGAAHLAGLGGLRSGAGLVTLAAPAGLEAPLRAGLPEVLVRPQPETPNGTLAALPAEVADALLAKEQAVALGPGLGSDPQTDRWVVDFLASCRLPVVVDADGLGAFARSGLPVKIGTPRAILTPHAGELARLLGIESSAVVAQRFELVPELARRWNCVLVLKGSPSLIGGPDGRVFMNPAGDDALARGGSGDVLTGLIGGLLAQGLDSLGAALLGCYVHGRAGTLAAESLSSRSVLVRETAAAIGPVFLAMEQEASASARLRERIWPTT